ncbi:MAG TPA: hypothetical protein VGH32_00880 [Pirellulales bacterium]
MRAKHFLLFAVIAIPLLTVAYVISSQTARTLTQPKIIISKETTYLAGPLDKDGYVDYVAAINQAASKGVTPEDNAVVLLWQTLGPADVPLSIRDPYFKLLGIPAPSENGVYYRRPSDDVELQREAGIDGPWSAGQHPELAAWLAANDKSIKRFI